jgi:enoyl-CoA hydratase/carnithine racemase
MRWSSGPVTTNLKGHSQMADPETHAPPSDQPVLFERIGRHIALVTLNRPAVRNAVNREMARLLEYHVRAVEDDNDIRVAILCAAGDKAFCAGADLAETAAGHGLSLMTPDGGFAGFVRAARRKPWIAAVQGFALGGGLELPLACDLIIAAKGAVFGLPEPSRGILAGAGGMFRLPRAIPRVIALEMLITGEPIGARRAHELGLINRVVDESRLLPEAIELAERISANAPMSVRETLAIGRIANERTEADLWQLSAAASARVLACEDSREGPRAFVEKRPPVWRG